MMKIAILGAGNMGRALIAGLLSGGEKHSIIAYDKSPAALKKLPKSVATIIPDRWAEAKHRPDVVIIAVKPQDVADSLSWTQNAADFRPLWISIAAGVTLAKLRSILGASARICRVMPNTPALIRQGMSAYSLNDKCINRDAKTVETILSSCGRAIAVPEKLMNAVTGLSGSGPAYVYLFIEALIEGGVTAGLPLAAARELAIQTVVGSALLAQQSSESPAELKSRVMSPAGTTARGLMALEEGGFKYAVIKAVTSAAARAEELGG
jgi:pyrroline-5-carboxylate reductase